MTYMFSIRKRIENSNANSANPVMDITFVATIFVKEKDVRSLKFEAASFDCVKVVFLWISTRGSNETTADSDPKRI